MICNHDREFKFTMHYLLCAPELMPQMAGMGDPPETMNWSSWHSWSVVSGCDKTKLSKSSLGKKKLRNTLRDRHHAQFFFMLSELQFLPRAGNIKSYMEILPCSDFNISQHDADVDRTNWL